MSTGIQFYCAHCGVLIEAAVNDAGQAGACANCGREVTVPAAEPHLVGRPLRVPSLPIAEVPETPGTKKTRLNAVGYLGLVFGVLIFAAGVYAIFSVARPDDTSGVIFIMGFGGIMIWLSWTCCRR